MRLLSNPLGSFVRNGGLRLADAGGRVHVFGARHPGPPMAVRLHDPGSIGACSLWQPQVARLPPVQDAPPVPGASSVSCKTGPGSRGRAARPRPCRRSRRSALAQHALPPGARASALMGVWSARVRVGAAAGLPTGMVKAFRSGHRRVAPCPPPEAPRMACATWPWVVPALPPSRRLRSAAGVGAPAVCSRHAVRTHAQGRMAVTSISTSQPGLTSPATCMTDRAGRFGWAAVPKDSR
jgi:hypothetical protein